MEAWKRTFQSAGSKRESETHNDEVKEDEEKTEKNGSEGDKINSCDSCIDVFQNAVEFLLKRFNFITDIAKQNSWPQTETTQVHHTTQSLITTWAWKTRGRWLIADCPCLATTSRGTCRRLVFTTDDTEGLRNTWLTLLGQRMESPL